MKYKEQHPRSEQQTRRLAKIAISAVALLFAGFNLFFVLLASRALPGEFRYTLAEQAYMWSFIILSIALVLVIWLKRDIGLVTSFFLLVGLLLTWLLIGYLGPVVLG